MISTHALWSSTPEEDQLEDVAANVHLLVTEEMDVQHRLGYHEAPAEECRVCRSRAG